MPFVDMHFSQLDEKVLMSLCLVRRITAGNQ